MKLKSKEMMIQMSLESDKHPRYHIL